MFAALLRREKRRSSAALQSHCAQKIMPLRKAARTRLHGLLRQNLCLLDEFGAACDFR